MKEISLEETAKTPKIHFNPDKGILEIKGKFIPENAVAYFKPIWEWLEEYAQTPSPHTKVNIQLEYLNDSSSKCMFDVFRKLEIIAKSGNQIEINWYYQRDDDDMLETGEDYQDIIKVPFKFIELDD